MSTNQPEKSYWGVGLTIAIVGFMIITLGLLFFSATLRFDQVTDTHYEDASIYQERINAIKRTRALVTSPYIDLSVSKLVFSLPSPSNKVDSATIKLYKPDNRTLDRSVNYNETKEAGSDTLFYRLEPVLSKGKWLVKAEWWSDGFTYYEEKSFLFD
jgi:hypothetical protein